MSKKRIIAFISAIVICLSAVTLSSCSKNEAMSMSEGKISVSTHEVEFFMTRMKGTLYSYGYDVSSDSFWGTVVSTSGLTADDYYRTMTLKEVSQYMIAQYLFEKEGLELSDAEKNKISETIDAMREYAGSKNQLNSMLSEYGVNTKILESIYQNEQKLERIKEYYFGSDGLGTEGGERKKQEYLEQSYICFKQVFLASYSYKTVKDKNGDTVYYTDEKYSKVAYDEKNGTPRTDVYDPSQYEKDEAGDIIYYTSDGRIAYDTTAYPKHELDSDGNRIIEAYNSNQLKEVESLAKSLCGQDISEEEFEALIERYSELDGDSRDGRVYLRVEDGYYETQSSSHAYLDEIAKTLSKSDTGRCYYVKSDAGYHVVYRYDVEDGAYDMEEYKDSFAGFDEDFVNMLFEKKCQEYEGLISLDGDIYDNIPKMRDVAINILY